MSSKARLSVFLLAVVGIFVFFAFFAQMTQAHDPAKPQSTHAKVFAGTILTDGDWGKRSPDPDHLAALQKQLSDWLAQPEQCDILVDHVAQSTGDNNTTIITVWYRNH